MSEKLIDENKEISDSEESVPEKLVLEPPKLLSQEEKQEKKGRGRPPKNNNQEKQPSQKTSAQILSKEEKRYKTFEEKLSYIYRQNEALQNVIAKMYRKEKKLIAINKAFVEAKNQKKQMMDSNPLYNLINKKR